MTKKEKEKTRATRTTTVNNHDTSNRGKRIVGIGRRGGVATDQCGESEENIWERSWETEQLFCRSINQLIMSHDLVQE